MEPTHLPDVDYTNHLEELVSTLQAQLKEREEEFEHISNLKGYWAASWNQENHRYKELKSSNAALTKRVEELVEGLRELQFTGLDTGGHKRNHCQGCHEGSVYSDGKQRLSPCTPDCWLNRLIGGEK
jgi:hypothetical protein